MLRQHLKDVLQTQQVFQLVEPEVLDHIASAFTVRSFTTNQHIFHQGDEAKSLYIVLSGKISIESYTENGKVIQYVHLRSGDIFGEFAILDKGVRSAGARVMENAELAILTKSSFNNILDDNPLVQRQFLSLLVRRLRNSNHQIESLAALTLLQRTAQYLLSLSKKEGETLTLTQKELSERLHASREKVNVKLKELERMGAIERGHKKIKILSSRLLEDMSF